MSQLVPPHIEKLEPYKAGRSIEDIKRRYGLKEVYKLASNENPLGVSEKVVAAMQQALGNVNRYGDPLSVALRQKLAERFRVKIDNVIVGAGSEGIMSNIIRAFVSDRDELLTSENTFIGFKVLAQSKGAPFIQVPMKAGYRFDLDAIADAITEQTKVIYLCNPNNPTGTIFTREEFDRFITRVPERVIIILDEAYFEYAAFDPVYPDSMSYRYDNVITLRTFSKAFGLAGLRVGYGFAHEKFITNLLKVKLPFEPNSIAQAAALASLDDEAFLKKSVELNREGYATLTQALTELGYAWVPSWANFVMLDLQTEERVNELDEFLLQNGVIARPLKAFGLPHALRISIGLPEENARCIELLEKFAKLHAAHSENL
ncbi:MAG: histidinol-phosphate transaminase [Chloroherpetonaceae bacterium]|nr:histidinol-phosphate transaminase [Chloroherpetonaceae bacterium]MCS7210118.1 histidinol-phosphate transaminase [Chloroherpetonaceae bacterium]MDW8020560.1 histidinol-phosphate transaminase [Chloroherpetonaceae bacterium]